MQANQQRQKITLNEQITALRIILKHAGEILRKHGIPESQTNKLITDGTRAVESLEFLRKHEEVIKMAVGMNPNQMGG